MLHQLKVRLNQLLKLKKLQLKKLNLQLLKRTRSTKSKRKALNSQKHQPHKKLHLTVLRQLQKNLLEQLQRLELFTEEERQEPKLLRREPLLEVLQ